MYYQENFKTPQEEDLMKKLAWGVILVATCPIFFASAGNNPQGPAGSVIVGLLNLFGGGILFYFGFRDREQTNAVGEGALMMLREDGGIDSGALAGKTKISELRVRHILFTLQKRELFHLKLK